MELFSYIFGAGGFELSLLAGEKWFKVDNIVHVSLFFAMFVHQVFFAGANRDIQKAQPGSEQRVAIGWG